jgi:starch-binding outer membrane protein, SusD/RagB family
MKKIISLLTVAIITLNSCSSFIEEENLSTVDADGVYKTAAGFESLVTANYSQLREIYGSEPWLFVAGTDLYAEGKNLEPVALSQYKLLSPSSPNVGYLYTEGFKAIQKANTGLYYSNLTAPSTTLDNRKGELKFLRANAYFLLVQTYGGVPIIKDYNANPVLSFDRNSAEEVYSFIESELVASLALLPTGSYTGRVNKRAALDLLAKVYLTRGYESFAKSTDFANAASYADQAIAGQSLSASNNTWMPDKDMNAETIFSVQFDPSSVTADPQKLGNAQGSYFSAYLGGSEVAGKAPYKAGTLLPTDFAISLYDQGDTRWENTFMNEIYEVYYDYYDATKKPTAKVRSFFAPKWFTAADKTAYEANLTATGRKAANYKYFAYGTYGANATVADYSGIPIRKFDDPKAPFATSGSTPRVSTRDFIVSRLSDTYLIAAEAYFKLNDQTTALARLNAVRTRSSATPATALTIDYILDERARELMGEYSRWFDLKRTGKLVERASLYHYRIRANGGAANFVGTGGALKILRPIPQDVIDLNQNKNFPQNPGY